MKLGTKTGSLINHLMSGPARTIPTVGMGATILHWTDRTACTIIAVNAKGTRIMVQQDKAIRVDNYGMSDSQDYRYEADRDGCSFEFSLRDNGRWVRVGDSKGGSTLSIGHRDQYHDYSF